MSNERHEALLRERERVLAENNDSQLALSKAFRQLRQQGYSLREIARVFGCSHEWVRQLSS